MLSLYRIASDGGQKLPANARQIICAARPATLRLTGNELFELADPDLRPARSVDVRFRNEEIKGPHCGSAENA